MKTISRVVLLLALLLAAMTTFAQTINMPTPEAQPSLTGWKVVGEHILTPVNGANGIGIEIAKVTAAGSDTCSAATGCRYTAKFTTNAELNLYAVARETVVPGEDTGTSLAARERRRQARLLKLVLTNCATLTIDPCTTQISAGSLDPTGP
jgi:hypothetical protein